MVVALHESGMAGCVEVLSVAGTPLDIGSLPVDRNPLGKIPALLRDDGGALYDSRVICRYLDDLSGGRLYPAAPLLWDTLVLEAMADGMLDAAVLMVYETRLRPEDIRFGAWVEAQWVKIARALDAAETRWAGHLAGPLDMGQIGLACALSYLDFRHSARRWRDDRPGLTGWHARLAARPSMRATDPPVA